VARIAAALDELAFEQCVHELLNVLARCASLPRNAGNGRCPTDQERIEDAPRRSGHPQPLVEGVTPTLQRLRKAPSLLEQVLALHDNSLSKCKTFVQ